MDLVVTWNNNHSKPAASYFNTIVPPTQISRLLQHALLAGRRLDLHEAGGVVRRRLARPSPPRQSAHEAGVSLQLNLPAQAFNQFPTLLYFTIHDMSEAGYDL